MEKTKVAIIGLGSIAQLVHLPNLNRLPNTKITAVSEVNKNRLNTISDKFNITERYTDYREMLENGDFEAVIIATPTNTHRDIAVDCLKARKDVMVEKPLARTYEEAKVIVDTGKKYKNKVMVGMNLRYRPDAMILKSLINSEEIGIPFLVKCTWIRHQSSSEKWFTRKEASGGGVIIDLGILLLDLSLWLLDYPPVESVSTQNFSHNTKNVEDTSISFLRCKNSALIHLESSWSIPVEKDIFTVTVYGNKGNASLNPFRISKQLNDHFIDLTPSQTESKVSLFRKSYVNELKSFIGAVRNVNPLLSTGDEALSRLKIIEAMYQSSSERTEIKI